MYSFFFELMVWDNYFMKWIMCKKPYSNKFPRILLHMMPKVRQIWRFLICVQKWEKFPAEIFLSIFQYLKFTLEICLFWTSVSMWSGHSDQKLTKQIFQAWPWPEQRRFPHTFPPHFYGSPAWLFGACGSVFLKSRPSTPSISRKWGFRKKIGSHTAP